MARRIEFSGKRNRRADIFRRNYSALARASVIKLRSRLGEKRRRLISFSTALPRRIADEYLELARSDARSSPSEITIMEPPSETR